MKASDAFRDRRSAGKALAQRLVDLELADPVVLAMPRGGVPVAVEIARALDAPLDLVLVRKIGVPYQPELAVAAIVDGSAPEIVVNDDVARLAGVDRSYIDEQAREELAEIERRRHAYLAGRPRVALEGRTLVLVDDGIATGASIRAALAALKRKAPRKLILAVPVAPAETVASFSEQVDEVVCLSTPEPFLAIGIHYRDFHQVPDDEVVRLMSEADAERTGGGRKAGAEEAR
ncbi:MAG: phosphoribosyltransferase [Hyphomicrobiaceae bacterium]|nr:phosphoribosyltransferase [Hyphomicrobiaceae bacterium]